MTAEDARALLRNALREVAPEADLDAADPDGLLQEEFGLDSLDVIHLVNVVYDEAGIDIPDRDFPSLSTFRSFVTYLSERSRPTAMGTEAPDAR